MRVPKNRRDDFQHALGLEDEITLSDPRVWLGHFAQSDIEASREGSGAGGTEVQVRLRDGALPTRSDEEIEGAVNGGTLSRLLRSVAIQERHKRALLDSCREVREAGTRVRELEAEVASLKAQLAKKEQENRSSAASSSSSPVSVDLLDGKSAEMSKSLCGLQNREYVEVRRCVYVWVSLVLVVCSCEWKESGPSCRELHPFVSIYLHQSIANRCAATKRRMYLVCAMYDTTVTLICPLAVPFTTRCRQ